MISTAPHQGTQNHLQRKYAPRTAQTSGSATAMRNDRSFSTAERASRVATTRPKSAAAKSDVFQCDHQAECIGGLGRP